MFVTVTAILVQYFVLTGYQDVLGNSLQYATWLTVMLTSSVSDQSHEAYTQTHVGNFQGQITDQNVSLKWI